MSVETRTPQNKAPRGAQPIADVLANYAIALTPVESRPEQVHEMRRLEMQLGREAASLHILTYRLIFVAAVIGLVFALYTALTLSNFGFGDRLLVSRLSWLPEGAKWVTGFISAITGLASSFLWNWILSIRRRSREIRDLDGILRMRMGDLEELRALRA